MYTTCAFGTSIKSYFISLLFQIYSDKTSMFKAMNQAASDLTISQHYEINEEQRVPSQQLLIDDIQLHSNSCYQITNFGRTTEQDKVENNYIVYHNDVESTNQLHHTHADVGLRGSKQKAQQIIPQNQAQNPTNKKKNKTQNLKNVKICLFIVVLINITLLLLTLSATGLSVVTYKKLPMALPEDDPVSMQVIDSNNNEELLVQTQLNLTQMNISQALAELDSTNNDIMLLQEHLDAIETNLTQVLLSLDAINNASQENAKQLASLQLQLYCGAGEWHRVAHLNMSDPLSQCPQSWVEENVVGVRACGRGTTGEGCVSTIFSTGGQQYRKVCGRAIGYQYGNTDAFVVNGTPTINEVYVDGLSITYGAPRQHIWTYAAAVSEVPLISYTASNCPCASLPGTSPPSYLGNNWYCESGNPAPISPTQNVLSNDPLWDGENCEGTCCSNGKSPPWFSIELSGPTNDDIEARICANEHSDSSEDVFIKKIELYIQ